MFAAMYKLEVDIILNPEAVDVRIKLVAFVGIYLQFHQELFIFFYTLMRILCVFCFK